MRAKSALATIFVMIVLLTLAFKTDSAKAEFINVSSG